MTARECVHAAQIAGPNYQLVVNGFIDRFRQASAEERLRLVEQPIERMGRLEGLVAGVVSALCRETGTKAPEWVQNVASPEPYFAFPARSFAMRLRLMIESPPAFKIRNVFVPENYLNRA